MPGNFFNTVVPRGAVFTTRGREFRVSNPTASDEPTDNRFNSILPRSASRQFRRFSLERLFTPLKRNKVTTAFRIPGSDVKANTVGFGAVFADVDQSRATNMRYFDQDGCLIARVNVRPINRGLSFAGIIVQNGAGENIPAIARVSIKLGTISVEQFANRYAGSDNIGDLVVMDDLFYGEPQSQF